MRRIVLGFAILFIGVGLAIAAGPYDGIWKGAIAGTSTKCPDGTIAMKVEGGTLTGYLGLGTARVPFHGTVAPDGSLNAAYDYPEHSLSGKLSGKLAGGAFTGTLDSQFSMSGSCIRNVTAKHS